MKFGVYRNSRTGETAVVTSEDQVYSLGKYVFGGNETNSTPTNEDFNRFFRWYEYVAPTPTELQTSPKERLAEAQCKANAQRRYL